MENKEIENLSEYSRKQLAYSIGCSLLLGFIIGFKSIKEYYTIYSQLLSKN